MRTALYLVALSACGLQEYEFLEIQSDSDDYTFECPDGERVELDNSGFTDSPLQISRDCLALDGACSSEVSSLDDPRCSNPSFNLLRGTCVEEFMSCFGAGGACVEENDGVRYGSGARWRGTGSEGLLIPPDDDDPCIIFDGGRYARVL